jgi:hypothetical protein
MNLNTEFLIWKERGRGVRERGWEEVRKRERGRRVSRSARRHI